MMAQEADLKYERIERQKALAYEMLGRAKQMKEDADSLHTFADNQVYADATKLKSQGKKLLLDALRRDEEHFGAAPSLKEARMFLQDGLPALQDMSSRIPFINISSLDSEKWAVVHQHCGPKLWEIDCSWRKVPAPTSADPPDFPWDREDSIDRFIPHLRSIIKLSEETDWVDAARDYPDLLSYYGLFTLGLNLEGSTDVLVAKRSAVQLHLPEHGMCMLFDIRQSITDNDIIQAKARVLLANILSPKEKPMLVSTNLCDEWRLMWMSGATIYSYRCWKKAQAVELINSFHAGQIERGTAFAILDMIVTRRSFVEVTGFGAS